MLSPKQEAVLLQKPIAYLEKVEIDLRTRNALAGIGIVTILDLLQTEKSVLLSHPNIGETTVARLIAAVKSLGF